MAKYGPSYVPKEVRYLREHGPSPRPEIEAAGIQPQRRYRHYDVHQVKVGGSTGNTNCGVGKVTPVHYLPEHDLGDVVRVFMETNPEMTERPKAAVTQYFGQHSREMREAWHDVADEYELPTRPNQGGESAPPSCDICGEQVAAANMTDHMVAHARGELSADGD